MAKVLAVKDKLEVLCRELQKANKAVVADAKASAAAEAAKRGALSDKFESGLGDLSEKLDAHAADRGASLKENEELRQHLRKLIERGDLQEAHLRKAKETFDLEKQLMEAQLAEAAERRAAADALRDALEQQLAAAAPPPGVRASCGRRGRGVPVRDHAENRRSPRSSGSPDEDEAGR